MEEARQRGDDYFFHGSVGKLDEEAIQRDPTVQPKEGAPELIPERLKVLSNVNAAGGTTLYFEAQAEPTTSSHNSPAEININTSVGTGFRFPQGFLIPLQSHDSQDSTLSTMYPSDYVVLVPSLNPIKQEVRDLAPLRQIKDAHMIVPLGLIASTIGSTPSGLLQRKLTRRPRYGPPWAGSSGVRPTQGNPWVGRVLRPPFCGPSHGSY
jgi:hypothetical protein